MRLVQRLLMSKFRRIYVEISNSCNLSCSFCKKENREKRALTVDEYKLIMDKIKPYTDYVYLHVKGEPLLHLRLEEILDATPMKINITTNGTLLNEKMDTIIRFAHKINMINISVHSNINNPNYLLEVKKFCEFVDANRLFYVHLRFWTNESQKVKNYFSETKYIRFSTDEEFLWPSLDNPYIGDKGFCQGLRTHIAILSNGDVVPCCLDHDGVIKLGNIFVNDLEDIINSPLYQKIKQGFAKRQVVHSLCQRCSYRRRFDG